jgi:murein DD-endopeptidase / murein LD-carboxypeptidase
MSLKTTRTYGSLFKASLFVIVMIIASACGSSRTVVDNKKHVEASLMKAYTEWYGTPYRLGGSTKSGTDCSGFVRAIFETEFATTLPRTTGEQMKLGRKIKKHELQTGDLVFFRTGRRTMHVGIYMGQNRFLHASTSNGIMFSNMTEDYWRNNYVESRRIFV